MVEAAGNASGLVETIAAAELVEALAIDQAIADNYPTGGRGPALVEGL